MIKIKEPFKSRVSNSTIILVLINIFYCGNTSLTFQIFDSVQSETLTNISVYSNLVQFSTTNFFLIRFSANQRLDLWKISNTNKQYNLVSNSTLTLGEKILFYNVEQTSTDTIIILTQNFKLINYKINGQNIRIHQSAQLSNSYYCGISIFNDHILLLQYNNSSNIIRRYNQNNLIKIDEIDTGYQYQFSEINTCSVGHGLKFYYLLLRNKQCQFLIYNCTQSNCTLLHSYLSNPESHCDASYLNSPNSIKSQTSFNADCTKFMFTQYSGQVKIYDIFSNTFTSTIPLDNGYQVVRVTSFLDLYSNYALVVTSSPVSKRFIYDISINPAQIVNTIDITTSFSVMTYDMKTQTIYMATDTEIYQMNFICSDNQTSSNYGICYSCSRSYCLACALDQTCYQCQNPYILNAGNCENIPTPVTNQLIVQRNIVNSEASSAMSIIGKSASFITIVLQIFPFTAFFIRFINYWTICSFYLLLNLDLPLYLSTALKTIYQTINASLFQLIGLNINLYEQIQQKFTQQSNQYNFSSNFLNYNLQSIILALFSLCILASLYYLKQKLFNKKNNNFLINLLDFDYTFAFFGQLISLIGNFVLILPIIYAKSYQKSWLEKVNMSLHLHAVFISIIVSFFMYICCAIPISSNKKLQKQLKNSKLQMKRDKKGVIQQQQSYTQQKKTRFYQSLCNILIPITALSRNIILFLVFNLFFHILGIFIAFKDRKFKINSTLLSIHIVLFHLTFIGTIAFDRYSQSFGIVAAIILFVGAFHQTVTLLCGLLYPIFIKIMKLRASVDNYNVKSTHNQNDFSKKVRTSIHYEINPLSGQKSNDKIGQFSFQITKNTILQPKSKLKIKIIRKPMFRSQSDQFIVRSIPKQKDKYQQGNVIENHKNDIFDQKLQIIPNKKSSFNKQLNEKFDVKRNTDFKVQHDHKDISKKHQTNNPVNKLTKKFRFNKKLNHIDSQLIINTKEINET